MQDACGVANTTGIHCHVDDLLFDLRRLASIPIVEQKGTPGTAMFAAAVPLLALTRRAMADNICTVAVRTVQRLENHSTSQTCWGGSAARRSQSIAHQHLCDIFSMLIRYHEGERQVWQV